MLSPTRSGKAPSSLPSRALNPLVRLVTVVAILLSLIPAPQAVYAAGGSYTIKWYAADPAVGRAPYLPTYQKLPPSALACPAAGLSGGAGRVGTPTALANAVAYAAPANSSNLDAVTSLAPKDLALGQVVPFEVELTVKGSTSPENGTISFTPYWLTKTTSGDNFGYDPAYKVYCAFVDTADPGTSDPGANAKVSSWSSTVVNTGTSNEQIQGTFNVSGLDDGDKVIVEIWVVLKNAIPPSSSGNVQTGLDSAQTASGDAISTGNQTIPLLRVREFFTSDADVSLTKSDSPDPVVLGSQLTYTLVATNNSANTIANGLVVTDNLDPNTTFVSGAWPGGTCTASGSTVTCNVGALAQGQSVNITIVTTVKTTAPTAGAVQTGSCTVGATGVDLCNIASVAAITSDPNAANNADSEPTNAIGTAALSLTKAANQLTYSAVGQPIAYTYELKNTGNVPLTSPYAVNDDKAMVTCPQTPSPLAVGATLTCSATYLVTQADLDAGSVTNKATATARFNGNTVTSNEAQATVTANRAPALSLVKTASPTTYTALGQNISYSYVVKNTGNVTLASPFTVNDDKLGVLSCPAGSLAPGLTVTCTASYVITQADLDAGSVTNTATATNGTVTSNQAQATISAQQNRSLSLVKTANPTTYDAVGQSISYSYVVKNTGNVTLDGPFTVTDNKTTVSCPAGSLAPGASLTCTASYAVTQADLDASAVTNKATATNGTVTSNEATATVNAVAHPNLGLVKSASPATYSKVGDVVSYSYVLTNIGNVALAAPYVVADDKATVNCPQTPNPLPVGGSITCSASYAITQVDLDKGSVTNHAGAHANYGGNSVSSNPAEATVNAVQTRALAIDKTATEQSFANAGDVLHYSYLVTNVGNVTLHDAVTVADDKATVSCPALPAGGLAPGASFTCTASYTVTQADLDGGSVTNVASASSGPVTSPTDTVTVPATQSPALAMDKSASPATYDTAGQSIGYSYVLKNTGNVTLSGPFVVSDDKATVSCPAVASLAPGDTLTCTASYAVQQGDVDGGSVTNVANAKATFKGAEVPSNPDTETVTAEQHAALKLTKSASPSTYTAAGQTISYSYVLENTGNVTLAGPFTVADDKATVSCPAVVSLAPNATLTCTASYSVTQPDLDNGAVTNVAKATASFGGKPVDSNQDTATVNAIQQGGLGLTKSASPATYDTLGQPIGYTYVVLNTGNVTLAGPFTVNDDKLGAVSCPAGSLAPGASVTCAASYTITQADLDAGAVTNIATATDGNLTSNEATAKVTADQKPALAIDKSADRSGYDAVGQVIAYSYLVTNVGNVTLHDAVTVADDKATVSCPALPAGGLAPGGSLTCTASYTVTQADLDGGSVTNVASASSGPVTSPTDTVTVPATQSPALALDKSASPATYDTAGQSIGYSYVLKNTGNVTLSGPFVVSDDKATVSCPAVASLAPGDTLTCTASYAVTQGDVDGGSVTNVANAKATFKGAEVPSNPDTETVTAEQHAALKLTKSASPSTYTAAGQTISYSYVLENTGNVTLAGPFTVADDKATVSCPVVASLAPNATLTCTASYSVTQPDLDNGAVTNVAKATASFGGKPVDSNQDTATVNAIPLPDLALDKSADRASYDAAGQVIAYTYKLTNIGNVTLAGPFTVSDDKATVTCPAVLTLAVGASLTCNAAYTVQQADVDAGAVTNIATGQAKTLGGIPLNSNKDQVTVPADQKPALAIDKAVKEQSYAKLGDVLHYGYVVTNIGNVTLHAPITVADDKATVNCPALPAGGLAPGAAIICLADYTVTQADLDAGSVTNVASATSGNTTSPTDTESVPAVQSPALALDKHASPATYDAVGQIIGYTYDLKNVGNVTLSGPFTVADDKASVSCPAAASLAPNATLTCTASYVVAQADLDAGSVTNVASAQAFFGGNPVKSNQDKATVTADQKPALAINKTATESSYAAAGDILHYSYEVTNKGNVTLLAPIAVSDDKVSVACPALPAGGLAPGASLTCTATYVVKQADVDAGKVTNVAFATSGKVTSPTDTETVTAVQRPALALNKTASPTVYSKVGDGVVYTYVLKNTGNVTLSAPFTVSDNKLAVTCPSTPTSLAPNATLTCTASYTIKQGDLDAGSITNVATATGTFGGNPVTSPEDTATVNANQTPVLELTKKGSPETYNILGQVISYSYELKNAGNVTLNAPYSVTDDKTSVTCPSTPATLAPGATVTCSATYAITQADLDAGSVTNKAKAQAYFNGSPVLSEQAQYTVNAVQNGKLTLVKTAAETTYVKVGDVLHYSYVVKNTGNITLNGPFTVSDDKTTVTCPAGNLAPGAALTCTASYTIKQSDLDGGSVVNHATATNGKVTSNQDQVNVPATQKPDLTLTKTASPLTYNAAGQAIGYSYVLKNTGNVTLSGPFTVVDDKTTATCPSTPTTLAPGASLTCTATYTVKQSDVDNGSVTNKATAYARFGLTTVPSNEAQATVEALKAPALALVKSASPATYSKVGDVISYSYVVKNTGNVTLPGPFSVSDDKLGTIACPAGSLAPNASVTCTATYTIKQSDLDAGSIKNTAKATTTYGSQSINSNQSSATVTAQQRPALTLAKSASPTIYSAAGQVVVYTYVATNSGNVTLTGPFSLADDKLGTFQCSAATSLAPGASLTCTSSYTIKASDLNATFNASITNKATVTGKFGGTPVTSNQAQATISQVRPTGQIAPTQTTCTDFANGTAADLTELAYNIKGAQINNAAPGVLFYYSKVTAPAASFTIQVAQTNDKGFPALGVQQESSQAQAILWSANCTKAAMATTITTDPVTQRHTVTYNVTGATPGQVYYVSIKYSPKALVGFTVTAPYPTAGYTFLTSVNNSVLLASQDSLLVAPK